MTSWTSASMLAIGLLRSISLQAVSHRSSASRRSDRDMPGSSGSKIPERAVRRIYWISSELTMTLFSLRQAHWHAWMSRGAKVGDNFDKEFIRKREEGWRRVTGFRRP